MKITNELLTALNTVREDFPLHDIFIGEAYQYDSRFQSHFSIGAMGGDTNLVKVFSLTNGLIYKLEIEVGKTTHSNYSHDTPTNKPGQSIQEFFANFNQPYPEFLLVTDEGSSNWGQGLERWQKITIMPCGFYR